MLDAKVYVNQDKTIYTIVCPPEECSCCHQSFRRKPIRITYKKPIKPMTIFESELIQFAVYGIPVSEFPTQRRYPRCPLRRYLTCQAGKEWLENIEKVELIWPMSEKLKTSFKSGETTDSDLKS